MTIVLYAHRWTRDMLLEIAKRFPSLSFVMPENDEEFEAALPSAEVLFGQITSAQYHLATNLKWIQYQGSGVNWINEIPELISDDIMVTNTRGAHASTIAEHTIGLLISLARGFYPLALDQANRIWRRPLQQPAIGLEGHTLGVLGCGQIGKAVASRSKAFHMKVIGCDIQVKKDDAFEGIVDYANLSSFLSQTNFLVITAPLTNETNGLIGMSQLRLLRKPSYVINVARGGIVVEDDLCSALAQGIVDGAGLDVQGVEPLSSDSPLFSQPNLVITPHCAGESTQTTRNIVETFCDNMQRFIEGNPLLNLVDKQKGY